MKAKKNMKPSAFWCSLVDIDWCFGGDGKLFWNADKYLPDLTVLNQRILLYRNSSALKGLKDCISLKLHCVLFWTHDKLGLHLNSHWNFSVLSYGCKLALLSLIYYWDGVASCRMGSRAVWSWSYQKCSLTEHKALIKTMKPSGNYIYHII